MLAIYDRTVGYGYFFAKSHVGFPSCCWRRWTRHGRQRTMYTSEPPILILGCCELLSWSANRRQLKMAPSSLQSSQMAVKLSVCSAVVQSLGMSPNGWPFASEFRPETMTILPKSASQFAI